MGLNLTAAKWAGQSDQIKSKYLRQGPYTHLRVSAAEDTIDWTFTFADLGMCHTLDSSSTLTTITTATGNPPGATYIVDGEAHRTEESAQEAVFGQGRFEECVRRTYAELGVPPS